MHSSLILLTLFSIILIAFMVGCFICFIRSRRKEEQELMKQVQYNNRQFDDQLQQQQQQQQQRQQMTPQRQKQLSQSPSANDILINSDTNQQYQRQQQQQQQQQQQYQSRGSSYQVPPGTSPYHSSQTGGLMGPPDTPRTETRSDITQQINSATIGSSEAEFQNDFIQVFPMYQIAPLPEKNTTPYMT